VPPQSLQTYADFRTALSTSANGTSGNTNTPTAMIARKRRGDDP
jgi:hypothetical protein